MPALRVSPAGKLWLFAFTVGTLSVSVASSQVMPPAGYPGTYPRLPVGGVGIPTRGKSQPNSSTKGQPMPNFRGKLKSMDAKTITLALDDDRIIDFRRTGSTKFFKSGDEVKDPKFNPGDQLSIEGPEDNTGAMVAVNVYWEKAAGATTATSASKDDKVPDAWADTPVTQQHGTQAAPPAATDTNDPGPPTLKRGNVSDASREKSAPVPAQTAAPAAAPTLSPTNAPPAAAPTLSATNAPPAPTRIPTVAPDEDDRASIGSLGGTIPMTRGDDLIRKAADTALDFTEKLPNYVCQELMSRYESTTKPVSWHALDVVGMEVVYQDQKEDYRKITLNGRPVNKKLEEMGGAWSTGEFGTVLIDLFAPQTNADFHYQRDSRMAGVLTKEYTFNVTHANSHWTIHMGSQQYDPAYKGTVWIDPKTARVMRIEMQAYGFPADFESDDVESATDYEYVRLGDAQQYLLPVHAETLSCQRGTPYCSRNTIDFRNYKKYSGESTITFGDPKQQ
jgi:hypothetical protein